MLLQEGERALEHKQLDNSLIQHPFLMGDWAIASQIKCPGLATPTWERKSEVRHQPCPELTMSDPVSPRLFFYHSVTGLFFFSAGKMFSIPQPFFLLISTPNSPQSFLIVQDNEKQILKKSITPKCISKVEQAPICKSLNSLEKRHVDEKNSDFEKPILRSHIWEK